MKPSVSVIVPMLLVPECWRVGCCAQPPTATEPELLLAMSPAGEEWRSDREHTVEAGGDIPFREHAVRATCSRDGYGAPGTLRQQCT